MSHALLCFFSFLAGFIDSVAGGGGLIQLPALLVILPPGLAGNVPAVLGTNKFSSIWGTGFALYRYARRLSLEWSSLWPSALVAFLAAYAGAWTVSRVSSAFLKPFMLIMMVVVLLYTIWNKNAGKVHEPRFSAAGRKLWLALVCAVIGFYDGFFGPGTGSFLIFALIGIFGFDFLRASGSAKLINFSTNVAAILFFAGTRKIYYSYAIPMAASNVAGSWCGTHFAITKGNTWIRRLFLGVVTAMIVRYGYEVLVKH